MSDSIKLYDLAPSPNNMKARIALNYKGLPFERIPVSPQDRSEIVKLSGQPLTPVLVHGDRVIFDSAAILRYLDANFRDTPPLFSADRATMQQIERWESFARTELLQPVGILFGQFFSPAKDPVELQRASQLVQERTGRIEERLAQGSWLVGDQMTAADVTAAPPVFYAMLPPAVAASNPIAAFFAEHLKLGDGRDRTREWAARVMSHDR